MGSAARQIPEQEDDIVSFFEPRFTALSNDLLHVIYSDSSVNPATRLLLFITRFSTGYLKPEVIMKESFILENTGMSRSSLYKAKIELVETGKITISHTKTGHCVYRIAPELQCLKSASAQPTAAEKAQRRWTSATTDLTRPQLETPMYKEKKKTSETDQQQSALRADRNFAPSNDDEISQSFSNASSQQAVEPDSELESQIASLEENWTPKQSSVDLQPSKSSAARPAITSEQGKLARQLHQTGIHWRIAVRLVRENDQQLIQNALARLKDRPNVKHPAGWLVEEIRAGGYNPPAPNPDTLIKQAHQTLADKRQQERQLAEIERDQANQKQLQLWAHFEKLPLDQRQSLIDQARRRLAKLSPKMAQAPLDSVPLRAMILELAQSPTLSTSLPMRE